MGVSATYNGYSISLITGKWGIEKSFRQVQFACTFLVTAGTTGALQTACNSAEEKLREINKDFSLVMNGTTLFSLSHSSNTGFLSRPSVSKSGRERDTATSREYDLVITFKLPFEQDSYGGQQEASYSISYSPERRRVFTAIVRYTATENGNTADDNYSAATTGAAAWSEAILSPLGNFELTRESKSMEREGKILRGQLTYTEILENETENNLDHAAIKDVSCSYHLRQSQETGRSTGLPAEALYHPPRYVVCSYSAGFNQDEVDPDSIEELYRLTIRPWIIKRSWQILNIDSLFGTGNSYITKDDTRTIDPYSHRLTGQIIFLLPEGSMSTIALSEEIVRLDDEGYVLAPLLDGRENTYLISAYAPSIVIKRKIVISKLGGIPDNPLPLLSTEYLRLNVVRTQEEQNLSKAESDVNTISPIVYHARWDETFVKVANLET